MLAEEITNGEEVVDSRRDDRKRVNVDPGDLVEVTHKENHEIYVSILNTGYGANRMQMVDVGVLLSNYPNPRPTVRILKTTVTLSSKSKTILSPK